MSWLVPACRLLACALPCTWPRKPTLSHWQSSPGPLYNTPVAAAAAPAGPRLPLIPHASLKARSLGPSGAFGDLEFMEWLAKGITVAVKRNGTECVDTAAIDNERSLYEKLMANPHDHVLPVYGICTDAPDGKVRLVMKLCEKGSLDALLRGHAAPEVGVLCFSGVFFALFSCLLVCACAHVLCACLLFRPGFLACVHVPLSLPCIAFGVFVFVCFAGSV